jgi:hypothetical protein
MIPTLRAESTGDSDRIRQNKIQLYMMKFCKLLRNTNNIRNSVLEGLSERKLDDIQFRTNEIVFLI